MDTRRHTPRFVISAIAAVGLLGAACNAQDQARKIGGVPLSNGTAHVKITGGASASFDSPLEKAQVGTVDTVFVYRSESNDLFSITGLGINGSSKTTNTLALVVSTGDISASSTGGECTITVSPGDGDSQSGTASCKDLSSSGGTIDLEATFSADP